jgi:septum formation protein
MAARRSAATFEQHSNSRICGLLGDWYAKQLSWLTMSANLQTRLILASASPRRKELLESVGVDFDIVPADVEEDNEGDSDPEAMVRANAELKARWVAERHEYRFVLGSDTTVHLDGRVLNKPTDWEDAKSMLRRLSGRTHVVYTGVSLQNVSNGVIETFGVRSEVTFKELADEAIDRYFDIVNPLDKAGAYGIQEGTEIIIESYLGSHSNIMGLPIDETKTMLERHGLA